MNDHKALLSRVILKIQPSLGLDFTFSLYSVQVINMHVVVDKADRIKADYISGSGDKGKSNLSMGSLCTKNSPVSRFFNHLWSLMASIDALTSELKHALSKEEIEILSWTRRNLFSASSYVYLSGDTEYHKLPSSFLSYMDKYIRKAGKELGGAKDFIIWDTSEGVIIQQLIIPSRNMDIEFKAVLEMGLVNNGEDTELLGSIINRLSAWFFWLGRMIYKRLGIKEKYWQGYVEEFPIVV